MPLGRPKWRHSSTKFRSPSRTCTRLFDRSATKSRPCESNASACGPMNSPGPSPIRPTARTNSPAVVISTSRSPSCWASEGRGQCPSATMMLPLGATAHAVGPMKVSSPAADTPAWPRAHQQLAVLAELVELEAAPRRRRVVAERAAVAGPQVAVAVHAEAVGLDDHPLAEALLDLPVGVDVVDGRLGAEHHPRAAGAVGDEADGGPPLHARPQGRPALDQAVGVGHRARRAPGQLEERRRLLRGRRDAHAENRGERRGGSELHDGAS